METRQPGRPAKPPGEARTETLRLRVKPAAKARLEAAAAKAGCSPTEALRRAVAQWVAGVESS